MTATPAIVQVVRPAISQPISDKSVSLLSAVFQRKVITKATSPKAPVVHRSAEPVCLRQFVPSANPTTIIASNPNTALLTVWPSSTGIIPLGAAKSVRRVVLLVSVSLSV